VRPASQRILNREGPGSRRESWGFSCTRTAPPFPRSPAYAAVLAVKGLRFAPMNAACFRAYSTGNCCLSERQIVVNSLVTAIVRIQAAKEPQKIGRIADIAIGVPVGHKRDKHVHVSQREGKVWGKDSCDHIPLPASRAWHMDSCGNAVLSNLAGQPKE